MIVVNSISSTEGRDDANDDLGELSDSLRLQFSPFTDESDTEIITKPASSNNPVLPTVDDATTVDTESPGFIEDGSRIDSKVMNKFKIDSVLSTENVNTANNTNKSDSERTNEQEIAIDAVDFPGTYENDKKHGAKQELSFDESIENVDPETKNYELIGSAVSESKVESHENKSVVLLESCDSFENSDTIVEVIDKVAPPKLESSMLGDTRPLAAEMNTHSIDNSLQMDIEQSPVDLLLEDNSDVCISNTNIRSQPKKTDSNQQEKDVTDSEPVELDKIDLSEVLGDKTNKASGNAADPIIIFEDVPTNTKRTSEDVNGVANPLKKKLKRPKSSSETSSHSEAIQIEKNKGKRLRRSLQNDKTDAGAKQSDKKENTQPEKSLYECYDNGKIIKLTKHGLEELIMQKVCDYLVHRGPRGEWRAKCAQLEDERDRLNRITLGLKRQLSDAGHIIKRLIDEKEATKSTDIIPKKVTRSVGLQVCTAGTLYFRPQSEFRSGRSKGNQPEKTAGQRVTSNNGSQDTPSSLTSKQQTQKTNMVARSSISNDPNSSKRMSEKNGLVQTKSATPENNIPVRSSNQTNSMKRSPEKMGSIQITQAKSLTPENIVAQSSLSKKSGGFVPLQISQSGSVQPENSNKSLVSIQRARKPQLTMGHSVIPKQTFGVLNSGSGVVVAQPVTVLGLPTNSGHLSQQTPTSGPITVKSKQKFRTIQPSSEVGTVITANSLAVNNQQVKPGIPSQNQNVHFLLATTINGSNTHIPVVSTNKRASKSLEVIDLTGKEEKEKGTVLSSPGLKSFTAIPIDGSSKIGQNMKVVNIMGGNQVGEVLTLQDQKLCVISDDQPHRSNRHLELKVTLPPLPKTPSYGSSVKVPYAPIVRLGRGESGGIMASWNFDRPSPTNVVSFEVFAFQDKPDDLHPRVWNKVGDVKALPLPMACTLTQFMGGYKYYFAVRALDEFSRFSEFSVPVSTVLLSDESLPDLTVVTELKKSE